MSNYEPIPDTNLEDLVKEASTELLNERRRSATSLIKNFLVKAEALDKEVKSLENQLKSKKDSLAKTLEKIKQLRDGKWEILTENQSGSKPDSERKNEDK